MSYAAEHTLRVAVVLAGCGRADGSEIHESVSVLVHLARQGAQYRCFAPDRAQAEVVDHVTGKKTSETRNMMVEAARISRGEISPLASLDPAEFDAVVFPGGFGAAKNLCTFAFDGDKATVDHDVARVLRAFHAQRKPIGLCCIAPVLAAKVLGVGAGGPGVAVTIGEDEGVAGAIASWGSRNIPRAVTETAVDDANLIVTTPAYMCDARPHEVFEGIGKMIDGVAALADKRAGAAPGRLAGV
jgi:enhancing lycopene biosynthesis protein 2